ncbi:MAG: M20/M25/M40 family metallo-hydrolase [Thermoleophilia bacterium]|nr:M20/M25/M40 family metallo-hydrolase [Thermoleophilia bacterium]
MRRAAPPAALVEDVIALALVPAPTFAEEARVEWLERRLAGTAGRLARDAVGNLIWSWGEGRPRLLLAVHVDTVFGPGTELAVRRERGRLVGPGIGDNAAAVAVAVHVVERLLAGGDPLAPGAVAFTVGEEGLGNLRGARHACERLEPEAVIALEGHLLGGVLADAVGSVRARVAVRGPGGHSWTDRGRPSAIHALIELAAAIARLGTAEGPVNVGTISGGRSVNSIADAAELVAERRSLEERDLDAFAAALAALPVEPPHALGVETVGRRPGGRLDRSSPLLEAALAVRRELGLPETLTAGSTDANAAAGLGIPALALGVSNGGGMHSLEEWIEPASLALGARQLELVLGRLLRVDSAPGG